MVSLGRTDLNSESFEVSLRFFFNPGTTESLLYQYTFVYVTALYTDINSRISTMHHCYMMTSSNGYIFRVITPLWAQSTGHRWIPLTTQRQVTRSFGVFLDLRLNQRLSKQSGRWWFEKPKHSLWHHCNYMSVFFFFMKLPPLTSGVKNWCSWKTSLRPHSQTVTLHEVVHMKSAHIFIELCLKTWQQCGAETPLQWGSEGLNLLFH